MSFGPQKVIADYSRTNRELRIGQNRKLFMSALSNSMAVRMANSYHLQFHTSAELETIFADVFGGRLGFCGFEIVGPRKWVQETGSGFKYLFHLHPQHNGFAYLPCGAISVDFVPRLVGGKFKIQPRAKNAAVHYSFGERTRWDWMIDKNRENCRQKVEKIAGESVTEITAWFQQFKSIPDVVAVIDQEKARSRSSDFYCYPVMVLAYSFALARIHRIAEARAEFEHVCGSNYYQSDLLPELRGLFEQEIQRSND